jgi:alpha-amylase/alpha-mannosidase (GH57 family)
MSEKKPLKIAILWHMHQPFYYNPVNRKLDMPWARLHALKDYLDMPLLATERKKIKVTFNLVPSLLDQIEMYCNGAVDRHLELTRIPSRSLEKDEKKEILTTFFSANYRRMIEPYPRYRQLFRKKASCGNDLELAVEIFSAPEWRDLQMWSNLVWVDPMFRGEEPLRALFEKGKDFTEDDKDDLLDFEIALMKRIIPTYQSLYKEGRLDISFTPYYHPILPLLIDSDVAREALPDIKLPEEKFQCPEDAEWQIRKAIDKFRSLFGEDPHGMWPSEGSVSEDTLKMLASSGIKWTATDQEVLHYSLIKSGVDPRRYSPHTVYVYEGAASLRIFYRDRGLSDKIGFVYSGWEADRAVKDFIQDLKKLRSQLENDLDNTVIPVILDGENAWEYFPNDGQDFLRQFYQAISEDDELETVFFRDVAGAIAPIGLKSHYAGSWINHDFKIWIGHNEDNTAWILLSRARKALAEYQKNHSEADRRILDDAWQQIYIAEGSDWNWWYGDEHLGEHNEEFDKLFRNHLKIVYDYIRQPQPVDLSRQIHLARTESFMVMPESLVTPILDGRLTHYYEWSGAGNYDCRRAGGTMHRAGQLLDFIYFGFDYESLYIRLDFDSKFNLNDVRNFRVVLEFGGIGEREISLSEHSELKRKDLEYIYGKMLELKMDRKSLLEKGSGRLELFVALYSDAGLIEKWPPDDPIRIDIPEREQEIFWQV